MGVGIAGLHYSGMAAMRLAAAIHYNTVLVGVSIALAIAFSVAALLLAFDLREETRATVPRKFGSALVMGAAISAMHYTGMAAVTFVRSTASPNLSHAVSISSVGTAGIAVVTLIILGQTMFVSSMERRSALQTLDLAREQAKTELARLSRIGTMTQLTASIAHEINQPITAVVTNVSAALRWQAMQPPNLDKAREAMVRGLEQANRVSEVIRGIRTLLKKAAPELQPIDINAVIQDAVALAGNELLTGAVTVQTELVADIPAVLGDRIQLQQVMLNLIMNAIDAMSMITDRQRELLIKSAKNPNGLLIQVQDSGKGLDVENVDRIFEPFFTTKPQGIGMGLWISRLIVEGYGGRLWANPRDPHGAVFQIILPKADTVA
jgi:signal transduction histidine kinase